MIARLSLLFDFKIYSSVVNICKKFNIKSIYDNEKEALNPVFSGQSVFACHKVVKGLKRRYKRLSV